jgi:acetylornithine deacetylase/succinyl-diaminopimelate desuccinylase-like protein
MQNVFDEIDRRADETVAQLARLCRQPGVSAHRTGLQEMAELMAGEMRELGIATRLEPTSTGVPVVYGELASPGASRTLLIYNHYDVQPAEPLELWTTPPFSPDVRDGRLYARGATDNKGNIVSRLAAIRALLAVHGRLPVNLKFLIEGEEEISSPGLPDFLDSHRSLLQADGCVWEDTMGRVDAPVVSLGNKGMCKLELRCRVASTDSHSAYAGIYPNALWRLVWALSTIKGPDERVTVPGFYDAVRPLTAEEQEIVARLPVTDGSKLKQQRGVRQLVGNLADADIHRRQSLDPTCNISGLMGGYTGPGTKTVIPAEAFARIDMRLVPDQAPEQIAELVRDHLAREGFDDIELHYLGGSEPSRSAPDNPLNRAIGAASRLVYGKDAIFEPHQAGSTPQWVIGRYLGMPCSATGVGYVTCMSHAPDENIRIDQLIDGVKYMATIMTLFAEE